MAEFDWLNSRHALSNFGGEPITLHIGKTGLPHYDAVRLYGAIDLYMATREDVSIRDCGDRWDVSGFVRKGRTNGRDLAAFSLVYSHKKLVAEDFCNSLRDALISGNALASHQNPNQKVPSAVDPVLQSGIRGISAAHYDSMNSSSDKRCIASVPLSEALLAYSGRARTETIGDITFLPVFEGHIDLGKIVSPLRAWLSVPSPLCAQTLMLLSLKTALWSEGYEKRLSAVTYRKRASKSSFNYSGVIRIDSTAIGRIDDEIFCGLLYQVFRRMLSKSWKNKKATTMAAHTIAVAEWLMQPTPQNLGPMIASQEFLLKAAATTFLLVRDNVKEVFEMTYSKRTIDYDAVRRLAKATSSAIYKLGPKEEGKTKKRKRWYNAVVGLRNAPNKEAFRHRVLTLIEQSRATDDWVGTAWNEEAFDPVALMESMGDDRPGFEMFRDCFRMYLIQESAPKQKLDDEVESDDMDRSEDTDDDIDEEEQD